MTRVNSEVIGAHVKNILDANNLNVSDAASVLQIGRRTLSGIVNGTSPLSLHICCRLEAAFGINSKELMMMQLEKDLEETQKEIAKENIQPYKPEQLNHL